jgi:uncharacterized membrane protein YcaP (DUF421 family)
MHLADWQMWHGMFALCGHLAAEKVVRTTVVYLALLLGLRLAGKRELAQLNPADLVVFLMLANTVQNAIIGNEYSITGGLIGAATLLLLDRVLLHALRRSKRLSRLLEGRPTVLVRHGKIQEDHLAAELITRAELRAAGRKQGIMSLHDVESCVLEPTGTLTFTERTPAADAERHAAVMAALASLGAEIAALRDSRDGGTAAAGGPTETRG